MRVHLFVPSDPEKLASAVASGADALWLEDPFEASALRAARQLAPNPKLYVGLGSLGDLDAAMAAAPDGIILPVRGGTDVQHLGVKLAVREAELGLADGTIRVIALVAGPGAVLQLGSFAGASPRLTALAFDARAFATATVIGDSEGAPAILARNLTVLAAKAAGVAAILVDASANSAKTCKAAKRDGFDAVVVRDPADIATVRTALK